MNRWLKLGTLVALVAVVALGIGAGVALAQGPGTTPPAGGLGLHLGGPQNSLVAIAAQTLGIEQTALVTELNAGKTIAEVAKAKGVAVQKIVDAMVANRTAALKAAVDAKRITQAQMDAELQVMKEHVTTQISSKWAPHGAGMGRGYGMGRGFVDANKDGICDNCGAGRQTAPNQPTGQPFMGHGRWAR